MAGGTRTGTKAAGGRVTSPFTLVEAKLSVPIPRAGLIGRTELVDRLLASRATPLISIAAPPGYGKTTILGQWAERDERPVAWLSVDDGDNDLSVLLTYIAVALDRAGRLGLAISAMIRPGPTGAAASLGAAMLRTDTPFLLVLDDVHRLQDPSCLDALAMLIDHVPAGSQIAVAGRSSPGLPMARLRAEGRLLEIGTADLALRADEAIRLFRATGVRVPDVDVRAIVERTEGWAAGLYLAALSARSGREAGAEEPFTGGDVLVAEYMRSELLADLPARDLRFMTRTSVLERLSGSLCDAVTGSRGSADTLDRLERANLLLVPLDRHREWFRYHNLLRDLLALELERREPGRAPELLRRAAEWHRAYGLPETAVEYALAAGDDGLAAELIRPLTLPMFRSGRAATLERWFGWFDARDLMESHPPIAILRAWLLTLAGDAAGAERSLSVAERALALGSTAGASRSAEPLVACLRATRCGEGVARMQEDADMALMSLPPDDPWHPTALLALGMARRLGGEPDAETILTRAFDAAGPVGAAPAASVAACELGIAAAEAGRWGEAEQLVDRARVMIVDAGIEWYTTSFLTYALGARLAMRRGDGRNAAEDLARSQRLRPTVEHGVPWLAVEGRLQLVHAYLLVPDPPAARMLLREIREIQRRCAGLGVLDAEAEELERRVVALPGAGTGTTTLTTAEVRILAYLPTHLSFREIGERQFISRNTVKTHALSIYRKLGASSRSDAVRRAQEIGLIEG